MMARIRVKSTTTVMTANFQDSLNFSLACEMAHKACQVFDSKSQGACTCIVIQVWHELGCAIHGKGRLCCPFLLNTYILDTGRRLTKATLLGWPSLAAIEHNWHPTSV